MSGLPGVDLLFQPGRNGFQIESVLGTREAWFGMLP
jgi:hypothetical protein